MKNHFRQTLFVFVFFFSPMPALPGVFAAVHAVPGTFATIQAAVDAAADGDVVVVADGVYTGEGNKNVDLKGKAVTVKSASGAASCVIDRQGTGTGFRVARGEGQDARIEGFTIVNGRNFNGGGIYLAGAVATIANSIIIGNSTGSDFDAWGGGIYGGSGSTITNCIIRGNFPNQGSVSSSTYCNIEGIGGGLGNIDLNPASADAENGDFRHDIKENDSFVGKEYYEKTSTEVRLWGTTVAYQGANYSIFFAQAAPVVGWSSMQAEEQRSTTTAATIAQYPKNKA